ncbi:putative motility protein [Aminipila butyrica]|uniref:Putative motility protein n=1 Tax=Aminipila butyrica TaxID=433296 RepID=A0A858BW75_9FIRM|nr:YjfB family protein [Aminipila butyrica]QIB69662.1 putative motility protein [Aminipila butyrica]
MDGILSSYMGMQAQQLQQAVSMSVLNMAMGSQSQVMEDMLANIPETVQPVPVAPGELGFNLDIYA